MGTELPLSTEKDAFFSMMMLLNAAVVVLPFTIVKVDPGLARNPLQKAKCSWEDVENRRTWKGSTGPSTCQTCKCTEHQGSLFLDCQSQLRPTAWPPGCIPKPKGCRIVMVKRENHKVKCPIIAYTAYRHMLWIADREYAELTGGDNEVTGSGGEH